MAPEVGLEPTTHRLTADCSTIELLWIPNGRSIYKPLLAPSTVDFRDSVPLAARTIERAPRSLDDAFDGRLTDPAGTTLPVINLQPLFIKIWRAPGVPVIKHTAIICSPGPVERHRAAEFHGLDQHLANAAPETPHLVTCEFPRRQSRRNARREQGFTGINIPHSGQQGLIEQFVF